jgi:hypothetical protein
LTGATRRQSGERSEIIVGKRRGEPVTFRLTAEERQLLDAYATARGQSPGHAARDLTVVGLRKTPPAPPTAVSIARKAAFAIIVALSPTLDEAATEQLLQEVYDQ